MANLNKLLVHVPSNLCDGFKTKYVNGTDRSYDNKVVFLEKTQEIFTKGKIYGTNIQDFNALKTLVGTIPEGATATDIVNYIKELVNAEKTRATGIESGLDTRLSAVETKVGEGFEPISEASIRALFATT